MDNVVEAKNSKIYFALILFFNPFILYIDMTGKNFHLFQNATSQIKNLLTNDASTKSSINECVVHDKPSTIDDANDCMLNSNEKKLDQLIRREPDLYEEDKFRACFIDCSCDCSVQTRRQCIPLLDLSILG